MKTQPAQVNYFFSSAFPECGAVIRNVFARWVDTLGDTWDDFCVSFGDLKDAILDVITFEAPITGFFKSLWYGLLFGLRAGIMVLNLVFTPLVCAGFSLFYLAVMLIVMGLIYVGFMLLSFVDFVYRSFRKISNGCPNPDCQQKIALPIYLCPDCGVEHTRLLPSKYGIWTRTCECGAKLPTTVLSGRSHLESLCPYCNGELEIGAHTEIWIPVIGGPSAGKTCLINMAISQIDEEVAPACGLNFEYRPNGDDLYEQNMQAIEAGYAPAKTSEGKLKFYQFHLDSPKSDAGNFISLCDVKGELFSEDIGGQLGFRNADGFIFVVDPLSIGDYRTELEDAGEVNVEDYRASEQPMDEVVGLLLTTLDNMLNITKGKIKPVVSVVFTKCDIPGLEEAIGATAVKNYMAANPEVDRLTAMNAVCERFLTQYGETNFIQQVKQRFSAVQFFTCSALGHNEDGTDFQPVAVEESVLWIVDKVSPTLNFKERLNQIN